MLNTLLKSVKSWVAGIFILLLVLSFSVWGVGDIFRGGSSNNVAVVGDIEITAEAFGIEYNRFIERLSAQNNGAFDSAQARQMGLDQRILYDLVQRAILEQMAARMGLTVSDQQLSQTIRATPEFSGTFGEFSKETYQEILQRAGYTIEEYEGLMRSEIVRDQLMRGVAGGVQLPKKMAEAFYNYRNEKRHFSYLVIPPDSVPPATAPTDEQIQSYFEKNAGQFFLPEYRTFTLILMNPENFEDRIEISEDELKSIYDFNIKSYQLAERRTVEIISFLTEAEAIEAREKLETEGGFDAVLQDRGLAKNDITKTLKSQDEILDPVVAEKAFSLETGSFSQPINGALGWAIVRVQKIEPGRTKDFEEVKDEIVKEKVAANASDELYKAVEALQDEIAAGETLEDAARTVGLSPIVLGPVDASGLAQSGKKLEELPEIPTLLEKVFSTDLEMDSDFQETGQGGYYIARVDKIVDARPQTLEEAKAAVIEAVKASEKTKALRSFAESITERANSGVAFETLANELGKSVLNTKTPLTRAGQDEIFSASMIEQLFTNRIGDYVSGPANFGEGYVIASVTEIIASDPSAGKAEITQLQTILSQSVQNDLSSQFLDYAENHLDVKIYNDVVQRVIGVTP